MADRALDFYMKGLPIDVRQRLFDFMKNEISETMMRWFLEKDDGYPSLHSCGYSDDEIKIICESCAPKFELVNQMMAERGRAPLFTNPHDACLSAFEHTELMKVRTAEELLEYFGCTYDEFVPAALTQNDPKGA